MADRIHAAGGEVISVSVDSPERQAAMFRRWPTPHVWYESDPGGERILQPLDLYDPDERDGIALPALLVIDPDGNEVFGYRGGDFADRRHDDDVVEALEALDLGAIDAPSGGPDDPDVDVDQRSAFTPAMLGPYFRGNRMAAVAIQRRLDDDEARHVAREHRQMCEAILEAWDLVRRGS